MVENSRRQALAEMLRNSDLAPRDRADMLLHIAVEEGLDHREAIARLVAEADLGRAAGDQMASAQRNSLASERFLGTSERDDGTIYAIVTSGPRVLYLPATPEQVAELQVGQPVLIDLESRQLVGSDGDTPVSGEIVRVESRPNDRPQHAVVRHHDQLHLVRLSQECLQQPDGCRPGDQVILEPVSQVVLGPVQMRSDGEELLLDPDRLANVQRLDVGQINPVVDEILMRIETQMLHPQWAQAMRFRDRCSYMFQGGTGTGKSLHVKLIAREYQDMLQRLTGTRTSRLVMVDASQFWSPYFGETEQRITQWSENVEQLGARNLTALDGRQLAAPLLICVEEAEALFRSRGEPDGSSHLFDRPLALFLQKIESLENALGVPIIWIATTNRPDLADVAALRRIGMRRIVFGMLNPAGMWAVLSKKIPSDLPMAPEGEPVEEHRQTLIGQIVGYLNGATPQQDVLEVTLHGGERIKVTRAEMVTPALLEEAVSAGVDACLRKSVKQGRLVGLDATDVIRFLHDYFVQLAPTIQPHNVAEYCPHLFDTHSRIVVSVSPMAQRARPPVSLLLSRTDGPT